ncbi:FAD/NAD(P)-binding protein [bacterium]|nr:FAD/NAD(P)-binding protein [bacterium]
MKTLAMPEAAVRDPMVPTPYVIESVRRETHDTFTLEMVPEDGTTRLNFKPGQFNMLYVFGVGEIPISISGDPAHPETLTHTTRAVGAVTKAMQRLKKGDVLGVRGPYGTQWPVEEAMGHDIVIVAGGIGLAPLRPIIYRVLSERERFGQVVLLYGTRSPSDILFKKELQRWGGSFGMDVFVTVDRGDQNWHGSIGVVTNLVRRAPFDPLNATAMVCGPEIMMRYCAHELAKRGVDQDRTYVSMERNMKCGIGLCGHCQYGPVFICKDGPVFRYDRIRGMFGKREI